MREFVVYSISGLTTAGIYAITASGLTLTYTTTGVFNFAHGAVGMIAAFAYWQLRTQWDVPTVLAFAVVVLVLAPLLGLGLERAVMRRLHGTTEVTKLVVTVAVALGLVALALWAWDPGQFRTVTPLWSGRVLVWGVVRVSWNDLTVLVLAGLVAAGLRILLYRTRVGVAMRATVDDPALAVRNGSRAVVNARVAWLTGSALAALAGILVAPKLSLSPLPLTLLIVNAYAAAVIGRLRSLPMTFVGALVLGLANDYGVGYLPRIGVGQQYLRGFVAAIPVVILFAALLALPTARLRGARLLRTRELSSCPTWRGALVLAAAVVVGTAMLSEVLAAGDLFNSTKVWGLALIGLSFVPLVGYAGRISLCQLGFGGIGAVVVAHLGAGGNPLALVAAAVVTAGVGVVVALPALRLSGIYLALSTAAFAVALDRWIFNLPAFTVLGHQVSLFRDGSLDIARPRLGPVDLAGDQAFFIAGAVVFALGLLLVVGVRRSDAGRGLLAMRDSPAACATLGMNVRAATLGVFALSAGLAGLGGALYGMGLQSVAASRFELFSGITILLAMVVAGVGTVGAPVFAGFFLGGPSLANLFPTLTQLTSITVAFAAIGVGRDPNGFIVSHLRPRWEPVARRPRLLAGLLASVAVLYGLRLGDVLDNWSWVVLTLVVVVAAPALARLPRSRPEEPRPTLEWLGLDGPYRPEDIAELDRALGLPKVAHGAP
ncbi:MAG: inner-rane translocator [Acidimicrobiales bacterium]|nr:inner-rane translocator [Acidimicrobiales bacterium]